MNQRIQELYRQAHSTRYYDNNPSLEGNPPTVYWQGEVSAQRFAELIVRECGIVADQWVNDEDNGRNLVSAKLRQHFGVEE